jgi:hypothetical protein
MEDKCPMCYADDREWKHLVKVRTTRTAHLLATERANKGIEGLEWEEVYALYFPKIFRHEYARNLRYEGELALDRLTRKYYANPDPNICCYHHENLGWFADGMHAKTMKAVRQDYAQSKWPNPIK